MFKSIYSLIRYYVGLVVFAVGLLLVLVAQTFTAKWAKISIDQVLATIGSAIIFSGAMQWMFETFSKPQLFRDITNYVLGSDRLGKSGLCDYSEKSKDVDYANVIEFGDDLTIAINYSPRLLEDYFELLKKRIIAGKKMTVIALANTSIGFRYAVEGDTDSLHIGPNLLKIERYMHDLSTLKPDTVTLIRHSKILKYSFVATKELVWFTMYRNSTGLATVPAIGVARPSSLYDFFWRDIEDMKRDAQGNI